MIYEPCHLDIRPSFARGPSLFQSAGIQTIIPAGNPLPWARDAPYVTSFTWGNNHPGSYFASSPVSFIDKVLVNLQQWFLPLLTQRLVLLLHTIRFQSSKSGKIYLHRDIRLLFSRKSMEVDSGAAYELQSFTESPIDPPFSSRCWSLKPLICGLLLKLHWRQHVRRDSIQQTGDNEHEYLSEALL